MEVKDYFKIPKYKIYYFLIDENKFLNFLYDDKEYHIWISSNNDIKKQISYIVNQNTKFFIDDEELDLSLRYTLYAESFKILV